MAVSKLVLIGAGVSVATPPAVALYLTSGETVVNHISKLESSKNEKFIGFVSDAETHLQKKYSLSRDLKKPTEDGKAVENIVEWCKESKNKKYFSDKGKGHTELQNAWEAYNIQKTNVKLEINDTDLTGATEKGSGGLALHDWCKRQDNKKMYQENSEDNYKRYEKWCFKAN